MVTYRHNDILNAGEQFICHQVNNRGAMGAGLALQIRNKFPNVFKQYRAEYTNFKLGDIQIVEINDSQSIINIFSQQGISRTQQTTSYDAMEQAFIKIAELAPNGESVALPFQLGCGLAGGDWDIVLNLIEQYLPQAVIYVLNKEDLPMTTTKKQTVTTSKKGEKTMTNLDSLSKTELVEQLSKAIALLNKQQQQHIAFKSKYAQLIDLFEKNRNGAFTVANWVEDELLVMSWKAQSEIVISPKDQSNWFYGMFENAVNLNKSKEHFTITVNADVKIGSAYGAPYFVDVDWSKVSDAKKTYLNREYDLNIPTDKQDDRYIRDEIAEELNQFMYALTGKSIEY